MRVAVGSDEDAPLVGALVGHLEDAGHTVEAVILPDAWTEVGLRVGRTVASGGAEVGIVCCWTGTGVSIAANKVPGIRAALCGDAATADGARRWNDANVLALGLRLTTPTVAVEVLDAFLAGRPDPSAQAAAASLE